MKPWLSRYNDSTSSLKKTKDKGISAFKNAWENSKSKDIVKHRHLQHEIRQVEDSLVNNEERNKLFSEIFESTYDRMMVGAEQIIRKMKNTYLQKKNFWKKIVEEHH